MFNLKFMEGTQTCENKNLAEYFISEIVVPKRTKG